MWQVNVRHRATCLLSVDDVSILTIKVDDFTWSDGTCQTNDLTTPYTVTFKANKNPGIATVAIKGKGNYSGVITKTFNIVPKKTSIAKTKAVAKGFSVTWKKQAKQTTGYQVQYSTNKTFKTGKKTVTVKGAKKISTTIKKLKSKKTYYVRIRTYKTVNGKKYYSGWSKVKKVKTK